MAFLAFSGIDCANPKQTALFLTVKSSNFCLTKVDNIKCGYLIVTDILISPDGVPLPFFNGNTVTKRNSGLKIIASFGGTVVPSELFAFLSCDDQRRATFVDNLVEFTLAHEFHGIDLAWLYPAPQERDQYVRLMKDMRNACDRNGLILTVTVPSRPSVIEVNYPVEKLDKYADYVILSTTEFRKLRKTSFIAPLYSCNPGSSNSIDYHVDRWKMAGLSCDKIVIVIQTMTLTYKLYIQNEYRVGTPALQLKIRPYYKICRKLYSGSLEIWNSNVKSPYAFRDLSWYSYENEKSIKEKVCFVVQQGLGGLAVFYYDEDDPINICGDGQYPLTAIVMAALESQYLPPSVITDSHIYHYESHPMPLSQYDSRNYNSAINSNKPMVVYVEGEAIHPPVQELSNVNDDFYLPTNIARQMPAPMDSTTNETKSSVQLNENYPVNSFASVEQWNESIESMSDEQFEDLFFPHYTEPQVDIRKCVETPSMQTSDLEYVLNINTTPQPNPLTAELYSENVPERSSKTCELFSEQSNIHPFMDTSSSCCKACTAAEMCTNCATMTSGNEHHAHYPCKPTGIRIFATAHAPTTTTTTTTTTPSTMQFYTMAPALFNPPPFFHACKPCVKVAATGSADGFKATTPYPLTTPPSSAQAQLYSEHSYALPASGIQIQGTAVGTQPVLSFAPFKVNICPQDGILQDPLDRRSYYLCKRGLPMCDENKFSCAHGYIFHETSKKCIPE
ncbi:oviduct-specific glycoprotein-like [Anopheles nili]|uniref:oviduct-specific glycoprotein-like n=1 Tax=Anopheles nili TaxID=185578 RepID=UPI00237A4C65|nr:oviduct-specific glycoprotein-like [Anopheles nili]